MPLTLTAERISLPAGAGNLPTLRLECDYEAALPVSTSGAWQMRFADSNHQNRTGWYEIVVAPAAGVQVFDSTAFGGASLSDELRAYPTDRLTAPLDERTAQLSFTTGALPASARPLLTRDGRKVEPPARDRLAELIAVRELTVGVALIAGTFAFQMFSRAPAFERMTNDFQKNVTPATVAALRADVAKLQAAGTELQTTGQRIIGAGMNAPGRRRQTRPIRPSRLLCPHPSILPRARKRHSRQ